MSSSLSSKSRLPGFDVAKIFAMFQVVLIHFSFYTNSFANTALSRAITSFTVTCVPLFIAVNGALLLNRSYNYKNHLARIIKYVILLFAWRLIHIALYNAEGAPRLPLTDFLALAISGNSDGYPLGHFWFLYALIGLYLLFPLIKLAWDKDRAALIPVCAAIAFLFCGVDFLRIITLLVNPFMYEKLSTFFGAFSSFNPLSSVGYLILYFIGGAYISEPYMSPSGSSSDERKRTGTTLPIFALVLCWLVTAIVNEAQYANGSPAFGVDYGYWLPSTVIATFSLLLLFLKTNYQSGHFSSTTKILGGSTFAVYMLHMPAIVMFAKIESGVLAQQFSGNLLFIVQLLSCALLYIALLLFGCLLKKIPLFAHFF